MQAARTFDGRCIHICIHRSPGLRVLETNPVIDSRAGVAHKRGGLALPNI